jgi:hypothetical protein
MQRQLDADYPDLDIRLMGINGSGSESANDLAVQVADIPWLQDVDADNNGSSDVWEDKWQADWRDVVILDGDNVRAGLYNLTTNDLAEPANFETLKQMLIEAALADQPLPPSGLDLLSTADSGADDADDVTNRNNSSADRTLAVRVAGVASGAVVRLYAGDAPIGLATAQGTEVVVTTDGVTRLIDGTVAITATQQGDGQESEASVGLLLTVDTAVADFTSTPDSRAKVGVVYTFDAQTPDEGEDGFQYSLTDAPAGVEIDSSTGQVTWTPTPDQTGSIPVTVVATDRAGNSRSQTFLVTVGEPGACRVSGTVFVDADGNGAHEAGEVGVPGSQITLSGTDDLGEPVARSVLTADDGSYLFPDLRPGTYAITQQQPEALWDGPEMLGSHRGAVGEDQFSQIDLADGDDATDYNFAERGLRARFISVRLYLASSPPVEQILRGLVARGEEMAGHVQLARDVRAGGTHERPATENYAPQAVDDLFALPAGPDRKPLLVGAETGVLANDRDEDGDRLTAISDRRPTSGLVELSDNGSLHYVPDASFAGTDTFTYWATDGIAKSETATVAITLEPVVESEI